MLLQYHFGIFSYTVMSFVLRGALAGFQRLNIVGNGLESCAVYLGFILSFIGGSSLILHSAQFNSEVNTMGPLVPCSL